MTQKSFHSLGPCLHTLKWACLEVLIQQGILTILHNLFISIFKKYFSKQTDLKGKAWWIFTPWNQHVTSRYRTYPALQEAPLCPLLANAPKSFGCFWTWYERNYTVCPLLCLTFFCSVLCMWVSSMYLHILVVYSFNCWVISHCMNISYVFIHSSMVAHLCCSQVLAGNIIFCPCILVHVYTFMFVYVAKSGITGS